MAGLPSVYLINVNQACPGHPAPFPAVFLEGQWEECWCQKRQVRRTPGERRDCPWPAARLWFFGSLNNLRCKRSSIPPQNTRPDTLEQTQQGPCDLSQIRPPGCRRGENALWPSPILDFYALCHNEQSMCLPAPQLPPLPHGKVRPASQGC